MNRTQVLTKVSKVDGWLTDHEALLLYVLATLGTGEGEILEIGSYKGKSTIVLALGLLESDRQGFVWAVDPHEGIIQEGEKKKESTHTAFVKNIQHAHVQFQVKPLVMKSSQAAKRWRSSIRLLFLDGLHDYGNTSADYAFWSPYVVNNGIIAFHDAFCGEEGVWKAVRLHCLPRKDIIDIGTVSSILYVVLGVPTGFSRMRVFFKKMIIFLSIFIHRLSIPWSLKKIVIHRFLRVFLLNKYTLAVYTDAA